MISTGDLLILSTFGKVAISSDDSTLHFRTHFGLKMNAKINNANNINK